MSITVCKIESFELDLFEGQESHKSVYSEVSGLLTEWNNLKEGPHLFGVWLVSFLGLMLFMAFVNFATNGLFGRGISGLASMLAVIFFISIGIVWLYNKSFKKNSSKRVVEIKEALLQINSEGSFDEAVEFLKGYIRALESIELVWKKEKEVFPNGQPFYKATWGPLAKAFNNAHKTEEDFKRITG